MMAESLVDSKVDNSADWMAVMMVEKTVGH